jgi:myosin-5
MSTSPNKVKEMANKFKGANKLVSPDGLKSAQQMQKDIEEQAAKAKDFQAKTKGSGYSKADAVRAEAALSDRQTKLVQAKELKSMHAQTKSGGATKMDEVQAKQRRERETELVKQKEAEKEASSAMEVGRRVFVPDDDEVWKLGTIVKGDREKAIFTVTLDSTGTEVAVEMRSKKITDALGPDCKTLPLPNEDTDKDGVKDMTTLKHLNEPAILFNLRKRFDALHPYTYTGDICIAINPYQWLPLYTTEVREQYVDIESKKQMPPHVYATSAVAFQNMCTDSKSQSVLVSGESGAGKTETTKIVMNHLATIASTVAAAAAAAAAEAAEADGLPLPIVDADSVNVVAQIIEANPLLESFGNAQTLRNDNSSRFGKFTQLQFDLEWRLVGCLSRTYLLEKSRVLAQGEGERNYHVFYQLLAGLEGEGMLKFPALNEEEAVEANMQMGAEDWFRYLGTSDRKKVIEGSPDGEKFAFTCKAMSVVGIGPGLQADMFRTLAAVLHLGQLSFFEKGKDEPAEAEAVGYGEDVFEDEMADAALGTGARCVAAVANVAPLIGCSVEAIETALTCRTQSAGGESYTMPLQLKQAAKCRDALAKVLYTRIFDWLVAGINKAIGVRERSKWNTHIAILDIFGFEHFKHNSYEQLCINYANEKLQQQFTADVLKDVQTEYEEERIVWDHIEFPDNQDMLELIEGRVGIINLLNEEVLRPQGSEAAFVRKTATLHGDSSRLTFPRGRQHELNFIVRHYACSVTYDAGGFLEKHTDALFPGLLDMVSVSSSEYIRTLFRDEIKAKEKEAAGGSGGGGRRSGRGGRKSVIGAVTVGSQFRSSLSDLMSEIGKTRVSYVRCLKPNPQKSAKMFDMPMVAEQLR